MLVTKTSFETQIDGTNFYGLILNDKYFICCSNYLAYDYSLKISKIEENNFYKVYCDENLLSCHLFLSEIKKIIVVEEKNLIGNISDFFIEIFFQKNKLDYILQFKIEPYFTDKYHIETPYNYFSSINKIINCVFKLIINNQNYFGIFTNKIRFGMNTTNQLKNIDYLLNDNQISINSIQDLNFDKIKNHELDNIFTDKNENIVKIVLLIYFENNDCLKVIFKNNIACQYYIDCLILSEKYDKKFII